jgi:hypothetical protein
MNIWIIIFGLCALLVSMPAEAGSGCGACPVGGGKKASSTQQEEGAGSGSGQQEASAGSDSRTE